MKTVKYIAIAMLSLLVGGTLQAMNDTDGEQAIRNLNVVFQQQEDGNAFLDQFQSYLPDQRRSIGTLLTKLISLNLLDSTTFLPMLIRIATINHSTTVENMNFIRFGIPYIRQATVAEEINQRATNTRSVDEQLSDILNLWWNNYLQPELQLALQNNNLELIARIFNANFDGSHQGRENFKEQACAIIRSLLQSVNINQLIQNEFVNQLRVLREVANTEQDQQRIDQAIAQVETNRRIATEQIAQALQLQVDHDAASVQQQSQQQQPGTASTGVNQPPVLKKGWFEEHKLLTFAGIITLSTVVLEKFLTTGPVAIFKKKMKKLEKTIKRSKNKGLVKAV